MWNLAISNNKNLKVDVQILYVQCRYFFQPIGIYGFKGYTFYIRISIQ